MYVLKNKAKYIASQISSVILRAVIFHSIVNLNTLSLFISFHNMDQIS